ncbi:S10 family peptidase [Pseudemcibacter aquimaris]|uniref:S10 family peptidase n=1 Tax=Pseudemcibacter aquimaris TaxID=2857064 RepID=UPI002013925E|nr:hypothetical protein [Pseudemcibacter aquimaris]MCC3860465.1 hypothetical protein [Pseudemcibacter aquimaris]WDU59290.1 hypothetical protein KW060_03310 [Pseudemcibacter aquimaris]
MLPALRTFFYIQICLFITLVNTNAQSMGADNNFVETDHVIEIGGNKIPYKAIAGTMTIDDENGNPVASVYSTTYKRTDTDDNSTRPITFAFNGGPGSASIWLHMGGIGPKRVKYDDEGFAPQPPYSVIENEYSILEDTDLVFIDPVFTGYSRPVNDGDDDRFLGVVNDAKYISEFVRKYLGKHNRWSSPKFLLGESYGTVRAGAMARIMQQDQGIFLNGIIVVSGGSIGLRRVGSMEFALNIPHFTATAWYHNKLPAALQNGTLEEAVKASQEFAMGDFASALIKGNSISESDKEAIAERTAHFTGLSKDYILGANLRLDRYKFRAELLREEGKIIGRLDSRHTGINKDQTAERPELDPSEMALFGAFPAAFNDYVRNDLNYDSDLEYVVSADVGWNRYAVDTWEDYRTALTHNEHLKVLFTDGYYDKLYYWAEHTIGQFAFPSSVADRISIEYYKAGHMMYVKKEALIKMKNDLAEFIKSAS